MIRRRNEQIEEPRPNAQGGDGTMLMRSLITGREELNDKGRLFSVLTFPKGASIGFHQHVDESEIYFILQGEGEFMENDGSLHRVSAGDVTFTKVNDSHGIRNVGEGDLVLAALILDK